MTLDCFLGIDAGTTSIKGALFTPQGEMLSVGHVDYTLNTPAPGQVELSPDTYWDALCSLTRTLPEKAGQSPRDVLALAISSQGETLICLDKNGQPVMDAIVWLDNRSTVEAQEAQDQIGTKKVYERTGQGEIAATWTATKIRWLKKNHPEIFAKVDCFMLLEDYLLYRLTGERVAEKNLLCSSMLYDIHKEIWWDESLAYAGITENQLPAVLNCGERVGTLTAQAAQDTGLDIKTLAVTGALDQTCGILGAGLVKTGMVTEMTGSCLAVSALLDQFPPYVEGQRLTCQNSVIPGRYIALLFSQTAGMALKWMANTLYPDAPAGAARFDYVTAEAKKVAAGSDGLLMLPHLAGAANPEFNPHACGVFFGITLAHTRGHFARALLESVAYMLRRNLDMVDELGLDYSGVYSLGGGSVSPLWGQIKADVIGKTMLPLKADIEYACRGAAGLAAVGYGFYKNVDAAADALRVQPTRQHEPLANFVYEDGYRRYKQLYSLLLPMMDGE